MQVLMRYGRDGLAVDLPEDWEVVLVKKPPMRPLADPEAVLERAMREPVDAAPLADLAGRAASACVLICDITRPMPNHLILPPLIRRLTAAGLPPEAITVLVATGLHRPNQGEELAEVVGDRWVLDTVRVQNHFARRDADHRLVGRTADGLPIRLDRRFVDADLKIAVGLVEPHFMAGFSGGRKLILPGIAHQDTIRRFHCARYLEHPQAANCTVRANPLHRLQMEALGLLPLVTAVNVVIDERRRPAFLNFGEIAASHRQAVDFLRPLVEVPLPGRFSTVLTCAGGYPLDKTYYQTVKGMVAAAPILAPGGDLVIVSECSEGMGSAEFADAQRRLRRLGPERFLAELLSRPAAAIDEWQTQMQLKAMRAGTLHLFSGGLAAASRADTCVRHAASPAAALAASVRRHGRKRVAVIPDGPYTIPVPVG